MSTCPTRPHKSCCSSGLPHFLLLSLWTLYPNLSSVHRYGTDGIFRMFLKRVMFTLPCNTPTTRLSNILDWIQHSPGRPIMGLFSGIPPFYLRASGKHSTGVIRSTFHFPSLLPSPVPYSLRPILNFHSSVIPNDCMHSILSYLVSIMIRKIRLSPTFLP